MSLALMVNPLISYAEFRLPLPCSDALWSTSNREMWRSNYLAEASAPQLTLADCLDNPTIAISTNLLTTSLACLSVIWRISWESIQMVSFQKLKTSRWSGFLLSSRHEELLKLLGRFRICLDHLFLASPDALMRLEHICLQVHAPFEDIQRFAGIEGPEQSRTAYPDVMNWVRSEPARRAVWHAGQIVSAAKRLHKTRLQGPIAVILFNACLVLWVYGILYHEVGDVQGTDMTTPSHLLESTTTPRVRLDGEESASVLRFVQLNIGMPCIAQTISDPGTENASIAFEVCLVEPEKVSEVIIEVLAANHPQSSIPPLVDNLIQVIRELQKSSVKSGILYHRAE
jgi:hypothetical protein